MSYLPEKPIRVSTLNSTTTPLTASQEFTGVFEDTTDSSMMTISFGAGAPAAASGSLYMEYSQDGAVVDRQVVIPVSSIAAPVPGIHTLIPIANYFRIRYVNGTTVQTQFRVQTMFHRFLSKGPTSRLFQTASAYTDVDNVRAFINAVDGNSNPRPLNATPEGHLEVSIADPLTAFGEMATNMPTPMVHLAFPFATLVPALGKHLQSGSGGYSAGDGLLTLTTGTGSLAASTYTSRRTVQYYPGNGAGCKFTAMFSTGSTNMQQYAGVGQTEEGFFFAKIDNNFGIVHRQGGRRPIYAFAVTVASTASANVTMTINGENVSVPVTNNLSTAKTAYEIAAANYNTIGGGWDTWASGSTVYFTSLRSTPTTGLFQGTGVGMSGSFTSYVAGVAATTTFVSQSSWNIDTLDGTLSPSNPSGLLLQNTFLNVYEINYQYLGGGAISFKVEEPGSGSLAHGRLITVHKIKYAGSSRVPSLQRPSLPIQFAVVSAGGTTDVSVSTASAMGYTQGQIRRLGPRRAISVTHNSVGTTYIPILSILNPRCRIDETTRSNSRISFAEAVFKQMSIANVGTKGAEVRIYRAATLNNSTVWTPLTDTSMMYDISATSFTGGTLIWASAVGASNSIEENFTTSVEDNVLLNANEQFTIVAASTSTTTDIVATLTWLEQGV